MTSSDRRPSGRTLVRGRVLTFKRRPHGAGDSAAYSYFEDGIVVAEGGRVVDVVDGGEMSRVAGEGAILHDFSGKLILPGFIDTHIHFPQTQVIASYGEQLLEWLTKYTFPAESRYGDPAFAGVQARFFIDELLRNGTTTAVCYGSVHKGSAEALLAESERRGTAMFVGKTAMDRNAPPDVLDTAQSAHDDTATLIAAWHGRGRQKVVITPRFAITSTPEQLEALGSLARDHPDCLIQTHLSENLEEIATVRRLFPERADYLDVYEHYGLVGPKSLMGHAIHLTPREIQRMSESGTVAVFCPTSNLFIGSGLFDYKGLEGGTHPVRIALATDIGGGTSYSMLATAAEAYKVMQLRGQKLSAIEAFHLMTRGNAEALGEPDLGRIAPGAHADLVVLDSAATPAMAHRLAAGSGDLEEELFVLMTLGSDRNVHEVFVGGRPQGLGKAVS
ncbi:guanine deaminase [Pleomorphomonas diazotrophica]|uniref:Guanine deaminase n=1 Tax=Pleomorphomonas diazotrophica TaxID=1166257 RepID=A0A1I4SEV8_9HYPH|nr:guanine deaminase [Pleomorphomonas diazotrophica]PKR88907.1 guanine deaminase [Pleomorphomonas diazotrophica]SFM62997.1 guanine deaminase [Pleomorphomonas diazotrophica]